MPSVCLSLRWVHAAHRVAVNSQLHLVHSVLGRMPTARTPFQNHGPWSKNLFSHQLVVLADLVPEALLNAPVDWVITGPEEFFSSSWAQRTYKEQWAENPTRSSCIGAIQDPTVPHIPLLHLTYARANTVIFSSPLHRPPSANEFWGDQVHHSKPQEWKLWQVLVLWEPPRWL